MSEVFGTEGIWRQILGYSNQQSGELEIPTPLHFPTSNVPVHEISS